MSIVSSYSKWTEYEMFYVSPHDKDLFNYVHKLSI